MLLLTMPIADNKFKYTIERNLLNKELIKWYYRLKGVRFSNIIEYYIIPSRFDIDHKDQIWWTIEEINNLKE